MAVLAEEAYEAGFSAGAQTPPVSLEAGWATFNVGNRASLPITLFDEFKRGYSSALSYRMDSY